MLHAILLAGGLSSRMGEDKGLLKINNQTLLQRSINLLKESGADNILISGKVEGYSYVPDLVSKCGPLGGLYSSLDNIKQSFGLDNSLILVIPVDMPYLDKMAISKVLEGISKQQSCHFQNEFFPCALRASEKIFSYLKMSFDESVERKEKRSMGALMRYLGGNIIKAEGLHENTFFNVNKPEDWEKISSSILS